jgi:hypothetical protein
MSRILYFTFILYPFHGASLQTCVLLWRRVCNPTGLKSHNYTLAILSYFAGASVRLCLFILVLYSPSHFFTFLAVASFDLN